jgi:hypothetical protein
MSSQKSLFAYFSPKRPAAGQADDKAAAPPPSKKPKEPQQDSNDMGDAPKTIADDDIEEFSDTDTTKAPLTVTPAPAPVAPPPPLPPGLVWCWINDDGKWVAFSAEISGRIVRA